MEPCVAQSSHLRSNSDSLWQKAGMSSQSSRGEHDTSSKPCPDVRGQDMYCEHDEPASLPSIHRPQSWQISNRQTNFHLPFLLAVPTRSDVQRHCSLSYVLFYGGGCSSHLAQERTQQSPALPTDQATKDPIDTGRQNYFASTQT